MTFCGESIFWPLAVMLIRAQSALSAGVFGAFTFLLAAAIDTRIGKVWVDRTPYSLQAALENSININLFDAAISGFLAALGLG